MGALAIKVILGDITVSEVAYTLKVTSNKRKAIYIDNIFNNTEPFNYDEITSSNNSNNENVKLN